MSSTFSSLRFPPVFKTVTVGTAGLISGNKPRFCTAADLQSVLQLHHMCLAFESSGPTKTDLNGNARVRCEDNCKLPVPAASLRKQVSPVEVWRDSSK